MPQLGTAPNKAVMAGPSPQKGNEKAAEEAMRAGMVRSRLATILHPENSHAFRVGTCIVQSAGSDCQIRYHHFQSFSVLHRILRARPG